MVESIVWALSMVVVVALVRDCVLRVVHSAHEKRHASKIDALEEKVRTIDAKVTGVLLKHGMDRR